MTGVCEETLGPGIGAYQDLTNAGKLCDLAEFDDTVAAMCKAAAGEARNRAMEEVDKKILCALLCCCKVNPIKGTIKKKDGSEEEKNYYQICVSNTVKNLERSSGHNSRFKAELSYNMRANPPDPLMDKDLTGNLNTRSLLFPAEYGRMKGRMNRDYPGAEPYGEKDTRRPDVIIVRDPSKPPVQGNISRVVEMKFGDPYGEEQEASYRRIGGKRPLKLDPKICGCNDDDRTKGQVALVAAAKAVKDSDVSTFERVLSGAGATICGVATVAAALFPLDGPLGEIALGSATAGLAARAFASTALSAASKRALVRGAAESWETLFATGAKMVH